MDLNKIVLLALLFSCGPQPEMCKTTCGVKLELDDSDWNCDLQQKIEDTILVIFPETITDLRFQDSCRLMEGYTVTLAKSKESIGAEGLTYCNYSSVILNGSEPSHNVYAHEMAHVIQRCYANSEDPFHGNWESDHISEAIDLVNAYRVQDGN